MTDVPQLFREESSNHWTHLLGVIFALSCIWMVWPAATLGWQWTMGVLFFIVGMFLMFLSSTIYHWLPEGRARRILRRCDHISIYVMIACSYTPICIAVIGGWLGWTGRGLRRRTSPSGSGTSSRRTRCGRSSRRRRGPGGAPRSRGTTRRSGS